jgi:hypothetical protein
MLGKEDTLRRIDNTLRKFGTRVHGEQE